MPQDNLEIVRRVYEAMNDRDSDRLGDLTHPDLTWVPDKRVGHGPVHGRERVYEFFNDRAEMFDELRVEVERLFECDDRVVAFIKTVGRGHASGVEVDIRIGHVWTIRDGLVVRGEGYGDRTRALQAAGLSE